MCENQEHVTKDFPTLPAFKEVLNEQVNACNSFFQQGNNPYSNTYNPGWKNHPNLKWMQKQAALQQQIAAPQT